MKGNSSYSRYDDTQDWETRWASKDEIKNSAQKIDLTAEKYPGAGLPLLVECTTAYVDNSDTHTIIFGSTGSKKTRLFCMPMLNFFVNAGESFIATDPKGELYAKTSGHVKAMGYKTIVLNFRDIGYGDMWNPLSIPYELYHNGKQDAAVSMINDFIATLDAPINHGKNDAFWSSTASSLGLANLLLLIENASADECNVGNFAKLSSAAYQQRIFEIAELVDENSLIGINYKGVLLKDAETTRDCIFASLFAMVRIFIAQENLTRVLSGNTFDIRKIGKEKTAVYIIVPDEKTTYHFLIATFIKQAYEILINEAQKEPDFKLPVRVNYVLDEFCNIPQIPDMPSMISAARSRNMRYFLVVQSLHQLKGKYGEDADTIKGNCDNWVFITSKELDLLNEISELCGNRRTAYNKKKKLISTSELQRFSKELGQVLIMHCRQYPIVVELPDIDDYEMFKGYEPEPMNPIDMPDVKNIDFNTLVCEIRARAKGSTSLEAVTSNNRDCKPETESGQEVSTNVTDEWDKYEGNNELAISSWEDLSEITYALTKGNTLESCEIYLLNSLLGAIYIEFPKEEKSVVSLIRLLEMMDVHSDSDFLDCVDYWFKDLEEKCKRNLKVPICNYKSYRSADYRRRQRALLLCRKKVAEYIEKRAA